MLTIDREKCIGCNQCCRVCGGVVLSMSEDGRAQYKGAGCIGCGHCVLTCPAGAITLALPEAVAAAPRTALEKAIVTRRSVRHYKAAAPDREVIRAALETARWAPNSRNQQLVGWSVVLGKPAVDALIAQGRAWSQANGKNRGMFRLYDQDIDLISGHAPCLIFAWIRESAINPEVDCAIAMATAELLLREKGLATCWGGFVTRLVAGAPELRAFAGIPEDAKLCCTLMVGIPDEHYEGIPARPAAEIVWRTDATF
jgi:nitroreductase/NAD-dependent dihydropyrimidine dehydrogenase PreA subunit